MNNQSSQSQLPVSLDDWLCYLSNQHHSEIDLGLTRITQVADALKLRDLSLFNCKIVLIGGTNGKGTTSRFIESYLLSQGLSVGLFNSPHLLRYNECVRINARPLEDQVHINAFHYIETHRGDVSLTPFEYHTLAAFYLFSQYQPDVVLVEVGMGGRLDSTNVIEPDISVVTTVDIDHQSFLGNDREEIGYEKAGIFRADKPAIVGDLAIPQSVLTHAKNIDCRLMCAQQDFSHQVFKDYWQWKGVTHSFDNLSLSGVPTQNLSTGLMVLEQLASIIAFDFNMANVNQVIEQLQVEGRMQWLETKQDQAKILLDVAHNPQAAQYLAEYLTGYLASQNNSVNIHAVVGIFKDKDIESIMSYLSPVTSYWYLCQLDTPRSAELVQLSDAVEKLTDRPHSSYQQVALALEAACLQAKPHDLIVVCGSFFTVAAALTALESRIE